MSGWLLRIAELKEMDVMYALTGLSCGALTTYLVGSLRWLQSGTMSEMHQLILVRSCLDQPNLFIGNAHNVVIFLLNHSFSAECIRSVQIAKIALLISIVVSLVNNIMSRRPVFLNII